MTASGPAVLAEDLETLLTRPLPWERLDGRTVLVTGAAGLVASYLVEALLAHNAARPASACRIVALVRDVERARVRFAAHLGRPDLALVCHDATEPLPASLRGDLIVHAAGAANPGAFAADPIGTYKPVVLGTHHLLTRAAADRVEGFLLLSTGAVHGTVADVAATIDETTLGVVDHLAPYACYAESKRMAETMCRLWAVAHGVPTRMARLGHSYGPGLRRDDDRAFAQFVWAVVDGRDIVLHSDGSATRPYSYLMDVVDGLLRVLWLGGDGEPYLVTDPAQACSVRELAEFVAGTRGDGAVRVRLEPPRGAHVPNQDPFRPLDVAKLRGLGWAPTVGWREGFTRTVRSCR